ncbi:virulence RhuM family protein [Planctomycetota bacterium]
MDDIARFDESDFLLYTSADGQVHVQCRLEDESIWLTQQQIAELFETTKQNISLHMINIYQERELGKEATVKEFLTVRQEGNRKVQRKLEYYNLDAIISVGYRVNSIRGTQFRIWATQTLKDYMIKGFALDDERLKQGKTAFGKDYFEELLERIRDIRASERRFYQKITDIYALSADYDNKASITREFFATVQNKLHWAITGKTAAEMIDEKANASHAHMGLTTWKNAPDGKILKSDVSVAKNYLSKPHIEQLNRIVTAYLELAENRALRGIVMNMADWSGFLDQFLEFANYPILDNPGSVSALEAKLKAEGEYEEFRKQQDVDYLSDFDKEIKRLEGK